MVPRGYSAKSDEGIQFKGKWAGHSTFKKVETEHSSFYKHRKAEDYAGGPSTTTVRVDKVSGMIDVDQFYFGFIPARVGS